MLCQHAATHGLPQQQHAIRQPPAASHTHHRMPATASFGPDFIGRVDQVLDAAQRLGLRVVRAWAFNDKFPSRPGVYDAVQGKGLDYFVAGAGRRGIRVELALANFWPGERNRSVNATIASVCTRGSTLSYTSHLHQHHALMNAITGTAAAHTRVVCSRATHAQYSSTYYVVIAN